MQKTLKQIRSEAKEKKAYKGILRILSTQTGFTKKEIHKYYALFDAGVHIGDSLSNEGDS